jgi:phosphonatase-like hydrolase
MSIALVVFDIAGTTVADKGNVKDAFLKAFQQAGYPIPAAEVDAVMGYRKKDAIKILLAAYYPEVQHNEQLIEEIHFIFNSAMIHFYETNLSLRPLPFAEETFRLLKEQQIKVALNTGFTRVITDVILNRLNWVNSDLIDCVVTSDEVKEGRPEPYMIEAIMKALGINQSGQVMKVGDTEVDVAEGRKARCGKVVSITTGACTREQLQQFKPDYIIESLSEISLLIS